MISTSIDRYIYAFVRLSSGDSVQITSSDYQTMVRQPQDAPLAWDGDLALPRAFLHHFGLDRGLSIFLASEVPPGTGLGLVECRLGGPRQGLESGWWALSQTRAQLAELAIHVETEKLHFPIGHQDQYASAFGGLNAISFGAMASRSTRIALRPRSSTPWSGG